MTSSYHLQLPLFGDEIAPEESRFRRYHKENPAVYELFVRFTRQAISAGRKRFSATAIIQRIRWETAVTGNDGFKINNNYSSYYARLFIREYPQHEGFFVTRAGRVDQVMERENYA